MDSKILLTSFLSGGTAGAIVSAVWGHISKLLLQKLRNERRSRRRYSRRSKRARQFSRANAGVVHALKPSSIEDPGRVFTFSSWVNLRDRLRVFGFATEQELVSIGIGSHRGILAGVASMGRNVELENFTSAMYEAREIAVERMQFEAGAAQAEGVVGVDIHEGSHVWKPHVIEFFAIGTAVVQLEQEIAPAKIADPVMVLSVND